MTCCRPAAETTAEEKAFVVHDSCVYARSEKVITPPRALLERAGLGVLEPELCRAATHCCGGPIEVLFPGEASRIAKSRMSQLEASGPHVATMCPICLVNLRKAGAVEVSDMSAVLAAAYEATP